jgi:hypothetical protein
METVQATRRMALAGTAAAMTSAIAHGASAAAETIWSGEYWATKQRNGADIRLAMYRKRIGAPQAGETSRPCCSWCTARPCRRDRVSIWWFQAEGNTRR